MSYASRFIFNSDFASFRSEGETTLTLTIPDEIVSNIGDPPKVFEARAKAPSTGTATRIKVSSSKYPNITIMSPLVWIHTRVEADSGNGNTSTPVTIGVENGEYVAKLEVRQNDLMPQNFRYYGLGQTLTIKIQTMTDPLGLTYSGDENATK